MPKDIETTTKLYQCSSGSSKTESEIGVGVDEFIAESNNLNHNLSSVISGINHEVAPWLGGAINSLSRLQKEIKKNNSCEDAKNLLEKISLKIDSVLEALMQATQIMGTVSQNIKRLKQHAVKKAILLDTIQSWFSIVFVSDTIKSAIEKDQIEVDYESLKFSVLHSPMLLTQVFLNLVKNAIDHNSESLATLQIRLYGNGNVLVVEDNGKGISEDVLKTLFIPEVTTKLDGEIHGLGLFLCREYCHIMGAEIVAENVETGGLRLKIFFPQKLE